MRPINNNITETYCSFEVSKLLKEKGFDVKCEYFFNEGSGWRLQNDYLIRSGDDMIIETPTHALAIEWIRVNWGLWVQPYQHYTKYSWDVMQYEYKGHYNVSIANGRTFHSECYASPQEATEAALLYTLTNLIN